MRHLIACPGCRRQYDASGLDVGTTLPCVCGQQVTVTTPKPHDASVVRCSSCGATRADREAACGYCDSDFTLHEQDLHTICPGCLARISDKARYCHHCALALSPQPAATAGKQLPCPTCTGSALVHRALPQGPPLLECPRCLGYWIEPHELRELLRRAVADSAAARSLLEAGAARPRTGEPLPASPVVYRACPECLNRMNRKRFPGGASVVVDFCREHGLWFEAEELERVLHAASEGLGDRHEAGRLPGDEAREREQRRRERNEAWRAEGRLPADPYPLGLGGLGGVEGAAGVLGEVLGMLGRLFR